MTGTARVESVVSDESFCFDSGPASRGFVFPAPEARTSQGASGCQVKAGVTGQEGRGQLRQQGAYVRAEAVALAPSLRTTRTAQAG